MQQAAISLKQPKALSACEAQIQTLRKLHNKFSFGQLSAKSMWQFSNTNLNINQNSFLSFWEVPVRW